MKKEPVPYKSIQAPKLNQSCPPGPASGKSGRPHINTNQPGNCDAANESPSSDTA
ncbi:MAG: hypothetical protein ACYS6K_26840 [Planctomycetota bacterium]